MKRRDLLAAAVAGAALPAIAHAQPSDDAALRGTLDGLAKLDAPANKLRALAGFDLQRLSPSAQLDLTIVRAGLAVDVRLARLTYGPRPYVVSPSAGAWRDTGNDPEAQAKRIAAESARIREDAARGVILPRLFLDKTIGLIAAAADKSPMLAASLRAQAELLVSLRPRSGEPGIGRLPNGTEYFALLLERATGTSISPAQAHARLSEKARELGARANAVLRRLGLTKGSVGARMVAAFRDPRFLYSDDDNGRYAAVTDMNHWLDKARLRLAILFDPLPPACLDVAVTRMTPKDEADGRQGYRRAPAPGVPGAYFVDLKRIRSRPAWSLASVVHHELLPGHTIQLPIENMAGIHPLRIEYCPGFSEGWAIYAEQLMAADGVYAGDDHALLGHLHWMLFRIQRALIDTGLHFKQASLEQAHSKLAQAQGEAAYFASFEQDIERISLEPALRAADALMWLELADRGGSAKARGAASLRDFHSKALRHGRKHLAMID